MTQLAFLRLVSTPAISRVLGLPRVSAGDALQLYNAFLASEKIAHRPEPENFKTLWPELALTHPASSHAWMTTYLAAFAMTGGYTLVTMDRRFKQFDRLSSIIVQD